MARGSLKSDILQGEQLKNSSAVSYFKSLKGKSIEELEDLRFAFSRLHSSLERYQSASDGTSDQQKFRKNQVVEEVNKLPDELRAAVTMPKEFISKLYRGAVKQSSPDGRSGVITASFTTDRKVAKTFMEEAFSKSEAPGGRKIYTRDDMVSFDGIINVNAINGLISLYNKEAPKESFERYGKVNVKQVGDRFSPEREYLVYGIEWKDEYNGRVIS
jgi:hypothetical protein